MEPVILSCAEAKTPGELHTLLARAMSFPAWYGKNLDALYDCLTELNRETLLVLTDFHALPFPALDFCQVFSDASEENPLFCFDIM